MNRFDMLYEAVMDGAISGSGKRAFPLVNDPNTLRIEFPWRPNTVEDIKTLAGRRYMDKYWIAPATPENVAKLKSFGFDVADQAPSQPAAAPTPAPAPVSADKPAVPSAGKKAFPMKENPGMLRVEFPYRAETVASVKMLGDRRFVDKGGEKYWIAPATEANITMLKSFGFEVDEPVKTVTAAAAPEAAPEGVAVEKPVMPKTTKKRKEAYTVKGDTKTLVITCDGTPENMAELSTLRGAHRSGKYRYTAKFDKENVEKLKELGYEIIARNLEGIARKFQAEQHHWKNVFEKIPCEILGDDGNPTGKEKHIYANFILLKEYVDWCYHCRPVAMDDLVGFVTDSIAFKSRVECIFIDDTHFFDVDDEVVYRLKEGYTKSSIFKASLDKINEAGELQNKQHERVIRERQKIYERWTELGPIVKEIERILNCRNISEYATLDWLKWLEPGKHIYTHHENTSIKTSESRSIIWGDDTGPGFSKVLGKYRMSHSGNQWHGD